MRKISLVLILLIGIAVPLSMTAQQNAVEELVAFPTSQNKPVIHSPTQPTIKIPILMYHHVGWAPPSADPLRVNLTVPPNIFFQEVRWLKQNGYQSITLEDLCRYREGTFQLPPKPIIFTFDDGYEDVFQFAEPILTYYGYKGSFAIITKFPGTAFGTNTYAPWDQIRRAYDQGMEIVSHTENHVDGFQVNPNAILNNLRGSIEDIQHHLGFRTRVLVYPYGHYTKSYIAAAQKAGFVIGVTTREESTIHLNDVMEIPRIHVGGRETLATFKVILHEYEQKPQQPSVDRWE